MTDKSEPPETKNQSGNSRVKDEDSATIRARGEVYLEAKRIDQKGRIVRTIIICLTILIGLGIIGAVIVLMKDNPPWIQVLAILVPGAPAAWVMRKMFLKLKLTIKDYGKYKKELELFVDANRTSSHLNEDGSSDDE